MEPITHGLTSYALSRAGLNKVSRWATPILIVSGYAPDWDWASFFGGPGGMMDYRRVPGHSLLGGTVTALAVALVFWLWGRRHATAPLRLWRVALLCEIGVLSHILLDLPNRYGIKLLWPFSERWFSWETAEPLDPMPLLLLLAGLLLPALLRLVLEEIGARREDAGTRRGAIVALLLVALYFGGRALLRERAVAILNSQMYRGTSAQAAAAYPLATNPLQWRGVVVLENSIEEVDVSLKPGATVRAEVAHTNFKPESSPPLETAQRTAVVQRFLKFARFPIAKVTRTVEGWRVEVRDVRFTYDASRWGGFAAVVELDLEMRVLNEKIITVPGARRW